MVARIRQDPAGSLVAVCRCGAAPPLARVLYLPLPVCLACKGRLWDGPTVLGLRQALERCGEEGIEREARERRLWQAGQWR